ncbi:PAS domain-containing protein [Chrysiogenes arsenatis]|uniref:PAS domain-containing protein n=1 Tax=Chrysiogenes arsenatis TaxID=309797 RepID=UPI000427BD11|nr:PAS domain-containing protein [Chrysiogenes arsenatis]
MSTINPQRSALSIAFVYLLVGALWIFVSDKFLEWFVYDYATANINTAIQTYKGLLFVIVTASILYLLLLRQFSKINQEAHERHVAQCAAAELSARLQHYLAVSPTLLYVVKVTVDGAKVFDLISPNIEKILGYSVSDAMKPSWWLDNIHPHDRENVLARQKILFEKGFLRHEYRFFCKNGDYLWFHDTLRLIKSEDGQSHQIIGVWIDITDRKIAEQKLQDTLLRQQSEIDAAVRKSQEQDIVLFDQIRRQSLMSLLVNLAHQWRQPLSAASIMIQNIESDVLHDEIDPAYVSQQVALAIQTLEKLSGTLTTFTALYESSDKATSIDFIESIDIVMSIVNAKTPAMAAVRLHQEVAPDIQLFAYQSDVVECIAEFFLNASAIAHERGRGTVHITLRVQWEDDAKTRIRITILDDAGGIRPEIFDQLFVPYTTTYFKSQNKGLGLYTMKRIIEERYRGEIHCKNMPDGAMFTVVLPSEMPLMQQDQPQLLLDAE